MFSGLIAGRAIDGADLAFPGDSFLQVVADFVSFKPSLRASSYAEHSREGDEKQKTLHPFILRSERSIARTLDR
jgi:hypothetical protein